MFVFYSGRNWCFMFVLVMSVMIMFVMVL